MAKQKTVPPKPPPELQQALPSRWWGSFEIPEGSLRRWTFGPLELVAERHPGEWRLRWKNRENGAEEPTEVLGGLEKAVEVEEETKLRVPASRGGDLLSVLPALADRPVVARPEMPLRILAGDELRLFVSTPLWLRVLAGEPPGELLLDLPIERPSDSWFGPSTREGELVYATRTRAWLDLETFEVRAHRAITEIVVRNLDHAPLALERLNLPVPHLALYCDSQGRVWSERVRIDRARVGPAEIHFDHQPPISAGECGLVAPARQPVGDNVLRRALSSLLR